MLVDCRRWLGLASLIGSALLATACAAPGAAPDDQQDTGALVFPDGRSLDPGADRERPGDVPEAANSRTPDVQVPKDGKSETTDLQATDPLSPQDTTVETVDLQVPDTVTDGSPEAEPSDASGQDQPDDGTALPDDGASLPDDAAAPPGEGGDSTAPPVEPIVESVDVVVVGAGCAGVAAAVEAASLGASVALLEETDWLGGQMSAAAVSTMDEAGHNLDSGFYADFIQRAESHYASLGKSMGTCYWSDKTHCVEASVARSILAQMLAEHPSIDLYFRMRPTQVLSSSQGGSVTVDGLQAARQDTTPPQPYVFHSQIVIDATEYGDVLALSPAQYRLANGIGPSVDPAACVQDITYTVVMRKYPGGAPSSLLVQEPPPGYDAAVEAKFAGILALDGFYWLLGSGKYPVDWLTHVGYRGVPDSASPGSYTSADPQKITRSGTNWANDFHYAAGNFAQENRKAANCEAKLHTLQFLYYVNKKLGITDWAIADDEGYDSAYTLDENLCDTVPDNYKSVEKHFPVMPYIREGRRLVGITTLAAGQIRRESPCPGCPKRAATNFETALAVGDYAVDLHGCNGNTGLETQLETTADVPSGWATGPFQVPFEVFIPESVDGLLATEKNLSVTRLVNGAIRLQPIAMLTGQAAGAIAATAVATGKQPRLVEPLLLQHHLVFQRGCRIALQSFADVSRDNPYWADVQLAAAHAYMNGYSDIEFGVGDALLRGWAALVLARLFGLDTANPPAVAHFQDVPVGHAAFAAVEALYAAGLTSGCSTNPPLFCPDDPLNRAALAKFLVSGLGISTADAPADPVFSDVKGTAFDWAFSSVQAIAKLGLMEGCGGGKFCPGDPVLRGPMARVLVAALLYLL
jgi:hypothetical protein